jgi:phosphopantetheinyl transferase (holo-ACP synthase)
MIGNDVVDLSDPETRAEAVHPRFDERVFVPSERDALGRSGSPARVRWVLWAAKEAAYKAVKQLDPTAVFSPRRFVVAWPGGATARVDWGDRRFDVTVDARPDWIHAIARPHPAPRASHEAIASRDDARRGACVTIASPRSARLSWGVEAAASGAGAAPELASRRVRELAVEAVACVLGVAACRLAVVRVGRLPILVERGRSVAAALSLSHHGRFVAFACLLDEPGVAGRSTV